MKKYAIIFLLFTACSTKSIQQTAQVEGAWSAPLPVVLDSLNSVSVAAPIKKKAPASPFRKLPKKAKQSANLEPVVLDKNCPNIDCPDQQIIYVTKKVKRSFNTSLKNSTQINQSQFDSVVNLLNASRKSPQNAPLKDNDRTNIGYTAKQMILPSIIFAFIFLAIGFVVGRLSKKTSV